MIRHLLAAVALLGFARAASAQPSVTPGQSVQQTPQSLVGGAREGDGQAKYCARETKPTTKAVYTTEEKEICVPNWSVWAALKRCFGCDVPCCEMRTRTVLVKKSAPGPDVPVCVVKELPAGVGQPPCLDAGPVPIRAKP